MAEGFILSLCTVIHAES